MRTALYPLESGSSPIMSMEIPCQHWSGTLLGISFPTFCVGKVFVQLHALHPVMNLATYLDSPGHQFHRVSCNGGSMVHMHQVMMELRVVQDINPTSIQDNTFCVHPLIGVEFPCI